MNNGTDVVDVTADGALTAIHQQGRQNPRLTVITKLEEGKNVWEVGM